MFNELFKSAQGGNSSVDLTQGQVAHYLLNNNADDSYGTYDGIANSSVDFQGDMAKFDGIGGVIDFDSTADFINGDFVLSLWITPTDFTRQRIFYSGYYTNATSANIILVDINHTTNGDIAIMLNTEAVTITSTNIINNLYSTLNEKFNLVIKRVSNTYYVYKNATLVGSFTGIVPTDNTNTRIGSSNPPSCYISNFRVYGEDKNQTFIDALYAEGYYPKPLPLPTTDGLIAHYPLTGTAEDTTGNYDGTENGGLTYVDDVEFGSVANFDGSSKINNIFTRPPISTQSFNVWFSLTSTEHVWITGDTNSTGSNLTGLIFGFRSDSRFYLSITDGVSYYVSYNKGDMSMYRDGLQHMLTVTFSGNIVKVYIDTILQYTYTSTVPIGTAAERPLSIGSIGEVGLYYIGTLSKFRFYVKELTTQEITDIYNYEKNFRPIDFDNKLVAYYPFAKNSLDNYYNQTDGTDTDVIYDGTWADYNGTTSYTNLNRVINISSSTVCFFVQMKSYPSIESYFIGGYNNFGDYSGFSVFYKYSTIYVYAGTWWEGPGIPLTLGTTYHVAVTLDAGTMKLYLDGELVLTFSYSGTANSFSSYFGARNIGTGPSSFADVKLGKLRIYDTPLPGEQITNIYNNDKGDFI